MYPVTEDFIQKMKADRRRVVARVEIDYTDPFMDQSLTIEASEQANVSYPQQTADSVDQTTRKYACLDGTWDLTSGEYHLAPSADRLTQQQFGWWGAQFAEKDGLKFDGIDDYVDCGNDFIITNQLTLEAWVKMNSYTAFPRIAGAENVWMLYITDSARNHRLSFYGSGIDTPFPNSPNLNDGKWHHVAAVYDGDGIDGYVDGAYVGTITKSGNLNDIGSTPVTIGGRTTGIRALDGAIREVRIWNSVRNQDEIRDNMYKELHGDESGLIGYWKINEGSGNIITDSAGSNDGTIYGATWLVPGSFELPYPTLIVRHLPRPIRQLKVVGDTAREEYPVDFTVKLYGPDDILLKTETVTGNDQVSWSKALEPQVLDVAKQELIITRWSLPGTCTKIVEFFTSIRETYETGDLVSLRLLEEREASQGSLPVGNISSNEITLALNNEDKKFDVDNEQSPLKNLLKPNRRIQVWLGAEIEKTWGTIKTKPWGEYREV